MTDDPKAAARAAYEQGASLRDVGKLVGVSRETIRRWATAGGWQAPEIPPGADHRPRPTLSDEDLEAARKRAEKASLAASAKWSIRRAEEADAVGADAVKVRQKIMELVKADKVTEARALSQVYATFVGTASDLAALGPNTRVPVGGDVPAEPRPTDPQAMAKAGRERAALLALVRDQQG